MRPCDGRGDEFDSRRTPLTQKEQKMTKVLQRPTLVRLRELEVLENVAATGKLNIVLGEKKLAERVVNLL